MPYIVVNSDHQEVDCRELDGPLIIGRAPDCQVSVRDILLSRRHCRIEKSSQGWLLIDLNSKNGTAVNGERLIAPRLLNHNDVVRMGRSQLAFHEGTPGEKELLRRESPRPIDPHEALAGTMAGFTLLPMGELNAVDEPPENMPCPQPKPKDPEVYQREELHELLTAIASSSWDSIYAEARLPKNPAQSGSADMPRKRPMRPRSPIDLSLQVSNLPVTRDVPEEIEFAQDTPIVEPAPPPKIIRASIPKLIPVPQPAWRGKLRLTAAALWVVAGVILMFRSPSMNSIPRRPAGAEAAILATTPITVSKIPPEMNHPPRILFTEAETWNAAAQAAGISLPAVFW